MVSRAEYECSLIQRGSITLWITDDVTKKWNARPSNKRGGQAKYSDLAIETTLSLGLVFHLALRQTEGCVSSIFELMGLNLDVTKGRARRRPGASFQDLIESTCDNLGRTKSIGNETKENLWQSY